MLRPLYPVPPPLPRDVEANIVTIPAWGGPSPKTWKAGSSPWLDQLSRKLQPKVRVLVYEYNQRAGSSPYIEQLQQHGHDLVEALKRLCADETSPKPLIFVCHSVGGLVLKKALTVLYEHQLHYLDVIRVVSGIQFISVPQLSHEHGLDYNLLGAMIKAMTKDAFTRTNLKGDENVHIAKLCHDFASCDYDIPMLSIFESVETRVTGSSLISRIRKARIIASKLTSAIGAKREHLVEVARPHDETCSMSTSDAAYKKILDSINTILRDAPALIASHFNASIPSGLTEGTLRSHSDINLASLASLASYPASLAGPLVDTTTQAPGLATAPDQENDQQVANPLLSQRSFTYSHSDNMRSYDISVHARTFESQKKDPLIPFFPTNLPNPSKTFRGRDDVLANMDDNLIIKPNVQYLGRRSFAICGLGGIGKTLLATQYAHSRRSHYDAIFWVQADQKDNLAFEYARIAEELRLIDSDDAQDVQSAASTFRNWLTTPVGSYSMTDQQGLYRVVRWLLVFDNVEDHQALSDYLPKAGSGSILITTRAPLASILPFGLGSGIDLTPLSEEDSVDLIQLLTRRPRQHGQQEAILELALILGGLPLLITSMAGVIRRLNLSYEEFLALYKRSGLERTNSYDNNSYDIFAKFGFERLDTNSIGMLNILAFLQPDRVSESILNVESNVDSLIDLDVTDFQTGSKNYYTARKHLLQSSLIYLNADEDDSYIELHRLVQHVTRQRMGIEREVKYFHAAVALVSRIWPFRSLAERWDTSRYDEYARHIKHVFTLRSAYEQLADTASSLLQPSLAAARLFNDAGVYLFERGSIQEAKPFFSLTQSICEASKNRDSDKVAHLLREAHNNQGSAAGETNDRVECLLHNKEWLKMTLLRRRDKGSTIDPELVLVYNEMGVAYAMNDQYDEAALNFLSSINICKNLPDSEDIMLGWPMPNLGFVYWVTGRHEEAEEVLKEILDIHEKTYGPDDTQTFRTGKILYALGNVNTSTGKAEAGYDYHKRCLRQYQATLDEGNHRIADTYHRLADHCFRIHDYDSARHFISRALEIFGSRSYYNNEQARSKFKEAQVLKAIGLDDEADDAFSRAFTLRRAIHPDDVKSIGELTEDDYDRMVVFWSR